jgi:hypothetical protein
MHINTINTAATTRPSMNSAKQRHCCTPDYIQSSLSCCTNTTPDADSSAKQHPALLPLQLPQQRYSSLAPWMLQLLCCFLQLSHVLQPVPLLLTATGSVQ